MKQRAAIFVLTCLILFAGAVSVLGTDQVPDVLFFENQEGIIDEVPLSDFLATKPFLWFSLVEPHTGNYKRYESSWAIRDQNLYLVKFAARRQKGILFWKHEVDVELSDLFPGAGSDVHATWYSGEIHLRTGPVRARGLSSDLIVTETTIVFKIANGRVVGLERTSFPENFDPTYMPAEDREWFGNEKWKYW